MHKNYRTYLKGIAKSVKIMESAKANGARFSEKEEFDLYFKKEVMRLEMGVSNESFISLHLKYLSNFDMVLARYYAKNFLMLTKLARMGYSKEDLVKAYRKIYKRSQRDGINSSALGLDIEDKNGKIKVSVVNDVAETIDSDFVTDVDSMVRVGLVLTQLFGSIDETDESFGLFLETYLLKEYKKVCKGVSAAPFVDDRFSSKTLETYLNRNMGSDSPVKRNFNVVALKASNN